MSYDPSHRKLPPRQARWPQATPPEPWQAYREDGSYPADVQAGVDNQGSYWATAAAGPRSQPVSQDASVALAADRGYQVSGGLDPFADAGAGYAGYGDGDYRGAPGRHGDASGGYPAIRDGYAPDQSGYAAGQDRYHDAGGGYDDGYGDHDGYGDYGPGVNGYDQHGYRYDDAMAGQGHVAAGYQEARDGFDGAPVGGSRTAIGYAEAQAGYAEGQAGYAEAQAGYAGVQDGYPDAQPGYVGARGGYGPARDDLAGAPYGYGETLDDFPEDEFAGGDFAGPAGYRAGGNYPGPAMAGPAFAAPDADIYPDSWQADRDRRREASRRGLAVGAVTGILAVAAAIGVATLAAGFVRPQASPITVLGNVFIDRIPAAVKISAAAHFGSHERAVLLLVMYVAIAFLALGLGMAARRAAALGVAGLAAFGLIAAYIVITRPGGRLTDLAPAVAGGLAGVAALLWLLHASAPVAPPRPGHDRGRRRTR